MKILNFCLVLTLFVSLSVYVDGGDVDTARIGLQAGESITDAMEKGGFANFLSKFQKVSPFLNGVVSVFKLIFGIASDSQGESAEMKYLRNLSRMINTRFDNVDAQLSDLEKLVQWSAVQAPYLPIALNIRAVSRVYQNLFSVPISDIQSQKLIFITNYESVYQSSGYKLFLGFVEDLGPFGGKLLDSAMSFYDNDRPKLRSLMTAITKLIFIASELEIGYYSAKGVSSTLIDFHRNQWEDRFRQIAQRMSTVDQEVASKWKSQYFPDIDRFARDNRRFNYSQFSNSLYEKLSTKYFWRDWLVIVSDHVYDLYDRNQVCGGYAHTKYGKDIIVTSVPKNKTYIEKSKVEEMVESFTQSCKTTSYQTSYTCGYTWGYVYNTYREIPKTCCCVSYNNKEAGTIYSWFNPNVRDTCTTYDSVGIIYKAKNVAYSARQRNNTSNMDCDHGWCTDKGNNTQRYPEFERLYVYDIGLCRYRAHFFG